MSTFWLTDNLHPSDHALLPELYCALIMHQALKNFLTTDHCVSGKYAAHANTLIGRSTAACVEHALKGIDVAIKHTRSLEEVGPLQMIELNERIKRIQKVIGAL